MGQAKQRGTFEQRRAEAVGRAKVEQAEQDHLDDLRYAERCKTRPPRQPMRRGNMMLMAAALAAASWPTPGRR
jgi:hypothetical protein